jgi:hypothetical protein
VLPIQSAPLLPAPLQYLFSGCLLASHYMLSWCFHLYFPAARHMYPMQERAKACQQR